MAVDRLAEGAEDGARGAAGITVAQLATELVEIVQRLVGVVNFIAQVSGDATEGVDVAEILAEAGGEEQRDDREILVMRVRQCAGERFRVVGGGEARERGRDGWGRRCGRMRRWRNWGVG